MSSMTITQLGLGTGYGKGEERGEEEGREEKEEKRGYGERRIWVLSGQMKVILL